MSPIEIAIPVYSGSYFAAVLVCLVCSLWGWQLRETLSPTSRRFLPRGAVAGAGVSPPCVTCRQSLPPHWLAPRLASLASAHPPCAEPHTCVPPES